MTPGRSAGCTGVTIGVIATPASRRAAGGRHPGRGRHPVHPELRARGADRAGRRRGPARRPVAGAADPGLPRGAPHAGRCVRAVRCLPSRRSARRTRRVRPLRPAPIAGPHQGCAGRRGGAVVTPHPCQPPSVRSSPQSSIPTGSNAAAGPPRQPVTGRRHHPVAPAHPHAQGARHDPCTQNRWSHRLRRCRSR